MRIFPKLLPILAFLALVMAPLCPVHGEDDAATELQGSLQLVTHESQVLGKSKELFVYVPPPRTEGERFPVLFVLHGKWGSHHDWPERANAAAVAERYRMILVFPDGEEKSWYLDAPLMAESRYESYVSRELVEYIDANYPIIPSRDARGIMGLSMGGHGALLLSAKHPDVFGSASSLSGILKLTSHPFREDVAERLGPWEFHRDRWEANSAWDQAQLLGEGNVRILFDCGTDDVKTGAIWDSRLMHERLVQLGIPHVWREHAGTHSWEYWTEHLAEHLNFHQAAFIAAQPDAEKWFAHYFKRLDTFIAENAQVAINPPTGRRIVFAGSSTTEAIGTPDIDGMTAFNRGISSDHLGIGARGLSKRLEESVFDLDPDFLVIKMGRNDIGDRLRSDSGKPTEDRMVEEYRSIIASVKARSPRTRIIVCTCAPVGGRFEHLKDAVISWNQRIRQLATEEQLDLVDLFPHLADENGLFRPEFTRDGLHLTPEANEIWLNIVREFVTATEATSGS